MPGALGNQSGLPDRLVVTLVNLGHGPRHQALPALKGAGEALKQPEL